jgi:hypothetical protein
VEVGDFAVVCSGLVGVVSAGFDFDFVYDFDFVFGSFGMVGQEQCAAKSVLDDFVSEEVVGPADSLLAAHSLK